MEAEYIYDVAGNLSDREFDRIFQRLSVKVVLRLEKRFHVNWEFLVRRDFIFRADCNIAEIVGNIFGGEWRTAYFWFNYAYRILLRLRTKSTHTLLPWKGIPFMKELMRSKVTNELVKIGDYLGYGNFFEIILAQYFNKRYAIFGPPMYFEDAHVRGVKELVMIYFGQCYYQEYKSKALIIEAIGEYDNGKFLRFLQFDFTKVPSTPDGNLLLGVACVGCETDAHV